MSFLVSPGFKRYKNSVFLHYVGFKAVEFGRGLNKWEKLRVASGEKMEGRSWKFGEKINPLRPDAMVRTRPLYPDNYREGTITHNPNLAFNLRLVA